MERNASEKDHLSMTWVYGCSWQREREEKARQEEGEEGLQQESEVT